MIRIPPSLEGQLVTLYDARDRGEARTIITSVRIDPDPRRWHLGAWARGALAGRFCVDAADGPTIVDRHRGRAAAESTA